MGSQNKTKRKALEKAFSRQKGKCHLCGGQMNMSLDQTNTQRATADHIIPKSLGGAIKGNIKAAHAECNVLRGNMRVDDFVDFLNGDFDPRKFVLNENLRHEEN